MKHEKKIRPLHRLLDALRSGRLRPSDKTGSAPVRREDSH